MRQRPIQNRTKRRDNGRQVGQSRKVPICTKEFHVPFIWFPLHLLAPKLDLAHLQVCDCAASQAFAALSPAFSRGWHEIVCDSIWRTSSASLPPICTARDAQPPADADAALPPRELECAHSGLRPDDAAPSTSARCPTQTSDIRAFDRQPTDRSKFVSRGCRSH